MPALLLTILILLLYALLCVLVLELILFCLGFFFTVPPKIRQILYAIVGVCFLIYVIQALASGVPVRLPHQ